MRSHIECLRCGCPTDVATIAADEWLCPYCGCGFVRLVLVRDDA